MWEEELYRYISGILKGKGQKPLAINGMPNHIHLFIGFRPTACLSDLVREVKKSSNAFINEGRLSPFEFSWQEGFGAFSYSHSQLSQVIRYVQNQKAHHKKTTFRQEYDAMLREFNISVHPRYYDEWFLQCGEESPPQIDAAP